MIAPADMTEECIVDEVDFSMIDEVVDVVAVPFVVDDACLDLLSSFEDFDDMMVDEPPKERMKRMRKKE